MGVQLWNDWNVETLEWGNITRTAIPSTIWLYVLKTFGSGINSIVWLADFVGSQEDD
jgi:hypothetical protein